MSHTFLFRIAPLVVCVARVAASPDFPNGTTPPIPPLSPCPSTIPTGAAFKVVDLLGNTMTIAGLTDNDTKVGRSDPFREGDPENLGALICSGGVAPYPNTLAIVGNTPRKPFGYPNGPAARRQVHTEILSLNLTNGAVTIKAGQPFYDALNPIAGPLPQARYFRNSPGEVQSNYNGNPQNFGLDFPAASVFNVYVEVAIPAMTLKLYNKTPLVLSTQITAFPPDLNLPNSTYIHDPTFGAVALFDHRGLPFGWLLSAGHGSQVPGGITLGGDALYAMPCPVTFCVDLNSLGLDPAFTLVPPNDVFADGVAPTKPLTLYHSSGAVPGGVPDMSNARSLTGVVGLPAPPSFANGEIVNAISFGRDGTMVPLPCCNPVNGTLFFSVSRTSVGLENTDVNFNSTFIVSEAAADVYMSAVGPFGRYVDMASVPVPANDNVLATDNTQLGLRPDIAALAQDNVTALELHLFAPSGAARDYVYSTYRGASFAGNTATIFVYDPASGAFQRSNLVVFATAPTMGLVAGDIIDALAVSDVSSPICPSVRNRILNVGLDEVLFSLAPGSISLLGADGAPGIAGFDDDGVNGTDDIGETGLGDDQSPATIFYSNFNGVRLVFALPGALGLRLNDDVDAIDIKPAQQYPGQPDCNANGVGDTCDILLGTSQDVNLNGIPDECQPLGTPFCPGDGTGAACPCGNNSPPGQGKGCLHSGGQGGQVLGTGAASAFSDTAKLHGSGMPSNGPCLYFGGTGQVGGGAGVSFGDGKLCIGGVIIRLGIKFNTAIGTSTYPISGDAPLSVAGAISPGDVRTYQIWYRDSAPFCTTATFNLTNGITWTWQP